MPPDLSVDSIDAQRVSDRALSKAAPANESRNLNRFFDELVTKAGVRRIRFHDLRHTCASLLLAQNVPARVVMEILGHSQLAMTTDLYSYVMPTALREAADAMDHVFVQPN